LVDFIEIDLNLEEELEEFEGAFERDEVVRGVVKFEFFSPNFHVFKSRILS